VRTRERGHPVRAVQSRRVIRGMLGFPEEDIEQFLEFVHIILEGIDHPEEERIIEFEPVEKYFVAPDRRAHGQPAR